MAKSSGWQARMTFAHILHFPSSGNVNATCMVGQASMTCELVTRYRFDPSFLGKYKYCDGTKKALPQTSSSVFPVVT